MGEVAYCFDDLVKNATVVLTNVDSEYPSANLKDEHASITARTTGATNQEVRVTFGTQASPQFFGVINHNFTGGTFAIKSYGNPDFTSSETVVAAAVPIRALDSWYRVAVNPSPYYYWKLDFTNATTDSAYDEIGRVIMAEDYVTLTEIEDFEKLRVYGFENIVNETQVGERWTHKLHKKRERMTLNWSIRTQSDLPAELRTLFETVYGDAHPFFFIPDIAKTDCYYVYIATNELEYTEVGGSESSDLVKGISLPLIEAVRGKSV